MNIRMPEICKELEYAFVVRICCCFSSGDEF